MVWVFHALLLKEASHLCSSYTIVPGLVHKPIEVVRLEQASISLLSTDGKSINADSLRDAGKMRLTLPLALLSR